MSKRSRIEEYIFLMDILLDLRSNYPEHNQDVLNELVDTVKYRIELEHKRIKTT